MNHLGDITKISGYSAPTVEVVIGGSPCQDLSVAGKRAGLSGERSGLFMEQIRVIKEMRQVDKRAGRTNELVRPRFMVWENVPGAFSSRGGEDFRAVLEETARVADPSAVIPRPPKGKWSTAGAIVADGWSIAWRILDAQFWGVPQRRRRIALVADFGGETAPEILFERKNVSGNIKEGRTSWEGVTEAPQKSVGGTGVTPAYCLQGNGIDRSDNAGCCGKGWTEDVSYTLNATDRPAVCYKNDDGQMIVRRLTPLEHERLQGFPDGWTDIGEYIDNHKRRKSTTDNARYKALGNSIAIPPWLWVLKRLNYYCKEHTMASLFDGIGGFPLIWERLNGVGSCLWASEIEEFPIAVTKKRFGGGKETKRYYVTANIPVTVEYGGLNDEYIEADSLEEALEIAKDSALEDCTIIGGDIGEIDAYGWEADEEDEE